MYTTELLVLLLIVFCRKALGEIKILGITGRNDDPANGKSITIPIELLYDNQKKVNQPEVTLVRPAEAEELHNLASSNPVLATLLLSYNLHISADSPGFNHPQHLPINPYVALLLSHYGRYIPVSSGPSSSGRGIYGYTAANNYHNNLPFGSYKIYTDRDA